jgi:hypothetical protein
MAVTVNHAPSTFAIVQDTKPIDFTGLTVAAGSNTAILAAFSIQQATPNIASVLWDPAGASQALTLIASGNNGSDWAFLYGRVGTIATGNKTMRVNITGVAPPETYLGAIAFDGVDQTFGTAFVAATNASGTSTSPSITITSATDNYTVSVLTAPQNLSTNNQTLIYQGDTGVATGSYPQRAAGAASVTHSWTLAGSVGWITVGVNIVAAAGGGGGGGTGTETYPKGRVNIRPAPFKPMGDGFRPNVYRGWR